VRRSKKHEISSLQHFPFIGTIPRRVSSLLFLAMVGFGRYALVALLMLVRQGSAIDRGDRANYFVPIPKQDVLTPGCQQARAQFNRDASFVNSMMEFYSANKDISKNCIDRSVLPPELKNCSLDGAWKKTDLLYQQCARGDGKVCYESLTVTVQGIPYAMKHVVAGCVPRACEDPRDQSTAIVMMSAMCNAAGITCNVNCVQWTCSVSKVPVSYVDQIAAKRGKFLRGNNLDLSKSHKARLTREDSNKISKFEKCVDHMSPNKKKLMVNYLPSTNESGKGGEDRWWALTST